MSDEIETELNFEAGMALRGLRENINEKLAVLFESDDPICSEVRRVLAIALRGGDSIIPVSLNAKVAKSDWYENEKKMRKRRRDIYIAQNYDALVSDGMSNKEAILVLIDRIPELDEKSIERAITYGRKIAAKAKAYNWGLSTDASHNERVALEVAAYRELLQP